MTRFGTISLATALILAACAQAGDPSSPPVEGEVTTTSAIGRPLPSATEALVPFDACDDLVDWTVSHALERVGPYGFDGYDPYPYMIEVEEMAADGAGRRVSETPEPAAADDRVIGTNLQEVGVDEPDLVKTDGRTIIAMSGSTLHVVEIDGDRLSLRDSIDLGFWTEDLFLDGDRVIAVAADGYDPMPFIDDLERHGGVSIPRTTPVLSILEIDISDPADPELTTSMQIDGRYVSSRMVDGAIRLVVSSRPTGFSWVYPDGGGLRAERDAERLNREIVETSTVENWIPYFIVTSLEGRDQVVDEGALLRCDRVHRPDEFSGLTTLSLVTLDPDDLRIEDATGVFADGDLVYSSTDSTYVATTRWVDPSFSTPGGPPETMRTKLHRFSLTPSSADYRASGSVPGYLLSQWAMSEHDGLLRVASTTAPEWWDGPESESMVTVLETRGDELRVVGQVDGLGRGERIYAVRFFADRGYVVTFRQVDPLYVIDLADAEHPRVTGELKIPGYSAYLHPVDDDHLLGIGRDADLDGGVRGMQASLFDVSDASDPARVDRYTMDEGHTEVEWDHHAFLHDPRSGLTVVPYERWHGRDDGTPAGGALVLTVDSSGIREIGTVSHSQDEWDRWMPIRRTLLIGGQIVTVSESGVMISDHETLDTLDRVEF